MCGVEVSCFVECVLSEVCDLVECGVCEIILLGQNVNVYYGDGFKGGMWFLVDLIWEFDKVDGLECICFIISYLNDMQDDLIVVYGECSKLMLYLYLLV